MQNETLPDHRTAGDALVRMRAATPLVHCITNYVAMNVAANVVLAAGASPAMVHAEEEVAEFVPMSGALTINIGTISAPWLRAMLGAADAAHESATPWVLDPVAHFITRFRRDAVAQLVRREPAIIRGNASEIIALAGRAAGGKGADTGDAVADAEADAQRLACETGAVTVVTGPVDFVTDGTRHRRVEGGHVWMPQVTALGCALTALTGAYAATEQDPLEAATAACAHFAAAGDAAGKVAAGPGSFATAFLDALAAVEAQDLTTRVLDA